MPEHETTREVFLRVLYDTAEIPNDAELLASMIAVPAEIHVLPAPPASPGGEERSCRTADQTLWDVGQYLLKLSDEPQALEMVRRLEHARLTIAAARAPWGLVPPGEWITCYRVDADQAWFPDEVTDWAAKHGYERQVFVAVDEEERGATAPGVPTNETEADHGS